MKDQSQAKQQQAAAAAAAAQQQQQQDSNNESKSAPPPQKSTGEEKQDDQPQQQGEEEEQEESQSENEEEEEVSDEDSEEEESDDDEDLEELYQLLVGKKVNKSGMVVDKKSGATIGRLVEGKLKRVAGKKVGENGEIFNDKGKLIGRVEPIRQEDDSEDSASDSEDEEESEQVPAEGDKEEAPTTQDKEEESTKNEAEKSEGKEEEQSKNEEELPKEEDAKVDKEDTSEEQEDAKVDENDVTEDQEEEDVKKSNEEPKQSDREITDSKDADKEEGKEEKLDATENEVEDLEVGDDKPAEDAVKSGAAAAVGGAAGVISKDGSKDGEDKPTIDEDSPVVKKSGKVLDMDDNVVGHVDKRMAAKLAGFKVDSEGNVVNDEGEVVGIAEMVKPEEPEEEDKPFNPNEMVDEDSPEVKKSGKVVDMEDNIVGSVDKKLAPKLAGFKVDQNGNVINHEGHIVAKAEMIKVPDEEETVANEEPAEEENKPFNPNDMVDENSPEVRKSGKVFDMDDNLVGHVDKRIAAKYAGCKVDEEGNVINQDGHVVGKAELIKTEEEPAEEEKKPFNPNELVDEDSPEVRKSGKVFDMDDNLVGHVDKRVASKYAGCKVDPEGNVIDNEGHIVARAEMIKPEEPEEPKEEKDKPFNPYAMVDENSPEVKKSGKVLDMDDNLVGHVDKRIASKLAGCKVDGDGNIINAEGHIAGKAEMIKEEEPAEEEDKNKPFNPNTSVNEHSPEVRRSGKVVDEDDNIVGHVDKSAAHKLAGYKVDWDGNIINDEGHIVGKAEMIKQKSEEERQKEAEEEQYRRIADQMSDAIQHSLDKIKPVLKNITDTIEAEEAKSEQDRNEEKLVETVKPLIEQGSDILNEAYGAIRGLDPSGKIAKTAQGKTAERKASPEEYHLAELLSQLTGEVSTTIDKSKKKIKNMPKAKKALSPLWNILQSPLLQILSAVGLLLTGVLGLVGQLLNGLGLGGIINSLLGGIGLNKILEGFGLGNALNLASRKR